MMFVNKSILDREKKEREENIRIIRIADPAIFDRSRGDSVADQMRPMGGKDGVFFTEADNTRLPGLMEVHERLRFDQSGRPMMYIFNTCRDWLRTVPNLPYSTRKVEDIDSDAEDHAYDETRYFLMSRPLAAKTRKPVPENTYTPFSEKYAERTPYTGGSGYYG